jgi:hypothetical protein
VCEELHSDAMNLSRSVAAMPLYYLHIRTGNKLEIDPEGVELPSLAAALSEAQKVARELLGEVPDLGQDTVIEVADDAGQVVQTVLLSDAMNPKH